MPKLSIIKEMRKTKYPSDISREQFEQIRPLLEEARKHTKPRTVDLYEVWCALLYVLKSGCQWRMLPSEHQLAVRPLGFPRPAAQKIANRF